MKYIKNEKGVTLIEVLAAIVILSIILGSIMNFFPQMGLINKINGDKAQAVNTAKKVLIELQGSSEVKNYLDNPSTIEPPSILGAKQSDMVISGESYYSFLKTEGNFKINILIKQNPDLSASSGTNTTRSFPIKVQPLNTKNEVITETYGYIFSE
jgi:prepilin-type N-terminal cleavage/methylation domain-containing protein